jgi:c-di-GMP-binding flagellar brake protein YcgR
VRDNAAKVATTANVGDDLYHVTEELREVMSQFTFARAARIEKDSNEKRAAPRLSHQLRVRFRQGDKHSESICHDLSLTGMKLRLNEELAARQPLDLDIFLPYADLAEYEAQQPVSVRGEVVWQRQEEGQLQCGVKFIDMDDERVAGLHRCFDYFHQDARYA